jgi:V-type H+-transporting ATPase proteolipid subunit
MAGIIAVYSLVIAVLISGDLRPTKAYSLFEYVYHTKALPSQDFGDLFFPLHRTDTAFSGFLHLAAGLSVGLTGLAAGYAIGVVGDVVSQVTAPDGLSGVD